MRHVFFLVKKEKEMTTLTMIWNDCNCEDVSDDHWYTVTVDISREKLRDTDQQDVVKMIMREYYMKDVGKDGLLVSEAATMMRDALKDYGLVGIFLGIPEEL